MFNSRLSGFITVATIVASTLAVLQCVPVSLGYFGFIGALVCALLIASGVIAVTTDDIPFPLVTGSVLVVVMLVSAGSWPMLRADSYRSLLGTVIEVPVDVQHALPDLDVDKAPLVSKDMAEQVAAKLLSQDSGLGSKVHVGEMTKQLVNGELTWVAFLEHNGFFRWLSNTTTPGYVTVSAHDASQAKMVTGKNIKILDSAWFANNVERKAWLTNLTQGFTDYTAEIDDEGNPYWVVTTYSNTVGMWGGSVATGVLTINAESGETAFYAVKDVPDWVDRVQPENILVEQVQDWGGYVHGFWNYVFSSQDVLSVSATDLVFKDGKAYWYVGLTSAGRDNGVIGYLLVDTKSKETSFVKQAGAQEAIAEQAVENVMPEKHYDATNALPFVVGGEPSYVMSLRDSTGIARAFGIVNIANYQILAVGDTLQEAAKAYQHRLAKGTDTVTQNAVTQQVAGIIARIGADNKEGNTSYVLMLEGNDLVMVGSSDLNPKLPILKTGDTVTVEFKKGASDVVVISKLEVTKLGQVIETKANTAPK